jgi:hypothetical protein
VLVDDQGKLPQHSNFRNILMAMLTLVRFSTGEGWVDIMHRRCSVSLLYWYKSTNTDATTAALSCLLTSRDSPTQ